MLWLVKASKKARGSPAVGQIFRGRTKVTECAQPDGLLLHKGDASRREVAVGKGNQNEWSPVRQHFGLQSDPTF